MFWHAALPPVSVYSRQTALCPVRQDRVNKSNGSLVDTPLILCFRTLIRLPEHRPAAGGNRGRHDICDREKWGNRPDLRVGLPDHKYTNY